jgi:hypothetical protein
MLVTTRDRSDCRDSGSRQGLRAQPRKRSRKLPAHYRHLGGMPHLPIAPSKWDTSMGTLELKLPTLRRFLRHDLAAIGRCSARPKGVSRDPVLANVHRPGTALSGYPCASLFEHAELAALARRGTSSMVPLSLHASSLHEVANG